ncbi:MAG: hypothetical protein JXB46_06620 [Candidatus Eisenbacteria bacterium]|nr:hypothetical protein [Candidatus Eisenbacteria bacterium]
MAYETYWEGAGIRWVYTGVMTDDDVLRSNGDFYKDERFESATFEIADLTNVAEFAASGETIRKLPRLDREHAARNPNIKVAIVVSAAYARGMANMYSLAAAESPWETRVFESIDDAREWLAGE